MKAVYKALFMPEIFLVLAYFICHGFVSPSFGSFAYYFLMNEAHITKF